MATMPGILTDWPWKSLGSFKHMILAPWAIHSTYSFLVKEKDERDLGYFLIFPFLLLRMLHNQIWISFSRYKTAKGSNRIVDKGIEFEQVDRESNWDDQIILNGLMLYIGYSFSLGIHLPLWRMDGVIMTILLHAGPVEFLYYWLHRLLHHHYLYSRYHSHHHSSIATEPITSVIHPFAEHIAYFALFAIPLATTLVTGTASIISFAAYITYIDLMNNMGHCNFELTPKTLFSIFPPLKFLMYTPSFHSLHHTQFRTNYSLFMPLYDYIYNTADKCSDTLYEASLKRSEDSPDVVHLMHLTTPESIYYLQFGFASLASKPYTYKWYVWIMWPITLFWSVIMSWIHGQAFISERNAFNGLKSQSWVVPKYAIQYKFKRQREAINGFIEEAILEADKRGVKVLTLGLLNQGEELNRNGEIYLQKNPWLKIKVVDGSSLAVAVVLNSIPQGTTQVLLRGDLTKVAYAVTFALCRRGIQVATMNKHEGEKLGQRVTIPQSNLVVHPITHAPKVWLVGDDLGCEEQMKAAKGTVFIPFSQFPPKKWRKDCVYYSTPAMIVPKAFENLHSCENWLPRRVMSAWRIAGILHALEGWNEHECGDQIFNVEKVWEASLRHGFVPFTTSSS
ncbi:very-long-chain aldehyde decarbonylase CER1 [Manihot esculenta]|uniref:Fatty acid hydroxylase domain-containing protein n=1 Tax=Manihot esculenta TaxID=3983 RepID=A0A2C9WPP5_MANES|nr:very-long-chain aldehyde decarbonylase CER1 [Manihot esculenta]OAY62538.1 hypothetical protein MANES_01G274900v8 [Manihot esculenta]